MAKPSYIYFVDNLLLFPTVEEFSKSVDEVLAKSSISRFLKHSVHTTCFYQTFQRLYIIGYLPDSLR